MKHCIVLIGCCETPYWLHQVASATYHIDDVVRQHLLSLIYSFSATLKSM